MRAIVALFPFVVLACSSEGEPPTADPSGSPGSSSGSTAPPGPGPGATPADGGASTPQPCGEYEGTTRFTCAKDGNARGVCKGGVGTIEPCARGCLRNKAPDDDVCMGTTDNFMCTAVQGTVKAQNGDYYISYFGCWVDANGVHHKDPNDNCLPGCLSYAQSSGLCPKSLTGQQCEEKTVWFTANNGRFGCLSRIRITNPANGRQVVAVVLDGGPACSAEQKIQKAMLDTSAPVYNYLFDSGKTWTLQSYVHVVEVDAATPLGIVK